MGLNELKDMGRVVRKLIIDQLAVIEAVSKKPNSPFQSLDTTGETT